MGYYQLAETRLGYIVARLIVGPWFLISQTYNVVFDVYNKFSEFSFLVWCSRSKKPKQRNKQKTNQKTKKLTATTKINKWNKILWNWQDMENHCFHVTSLQWFGCMVFGIVTALVLCRSSSALPWSSCLITR